MDMIDRTGEAESEANLDEYIRVLSRHAVKSILELPPDLALILFGVIQALKELRRFPEPLRRKFCEQAKEVRDGEA